MSPISRTSSFSSNGPGTTRRRLTSDQKQALTKLFDSKSHPSKEEREALAVVIGMDLKAVSIWFQNKRQTTKKMRPLPTTKATQCGSALSATISLDHIANLSERLPSASTLTASPPSKLFSRSYSTNDLWTRMPSSPVVAPSSPVKDNARFAALPARSKARKTLEFACAKARTSSSANKENMPFGMSTPLKQVATYKLTPKDMDDGDETDTDADEAITPDTSIEAAPIYATKKASHMDDMDAAMLLLGLMRR